MEDIVESCDVIFSTLSSTCVKSMSNLNNQIDFLIVDEST